MPKYLATLTFSFERQMKLACVRHGVRWLRMHGREPQAPLDSQVSEVTAQPGIGPVAARPRQ